MNAEYRLEYGNRTGADRNASAPCWWLVRTRNQQEVARVDRDWATGELQFAFSGALYRTAPEFDALLEALAALRAAANELPAYKSPLENTPAPPRTA